MGAQTEAALSEPLKAAESGRDPRPSAGFRFLILALTTACLTSICSNMFVFTVTMLCKEPPGRNVTVLTDEELTKRNSILIWALSIGSIVATPPFNALYARYGARWVFLSAGIISIISTTLVPTANDLGLIPFVIIRFIQGIALSANFAAIGMVCSRWAALDENGFFLSAMTTFSQISVMVSNPVAGALCESSWGWRSVYYVHAAVGPLLFGLWYWLYTDYPESHPYVRPAEAEKIMRGKDADKRKLDGFIPYKAICTNKVVLVVWFNAVGSIISAIFLLTYFPTYLKQVLGYSLTEASFISMFPAVAHVPFKLAFGWIFDKIRFISEVNKMRICNTISVTLSGVLFAAVGFIPNSMAWLSVACATLNYVFIGGNCAGFYKCGSLVSRQYAHFVVANIQFLKCVSFFVSPVLVYLFVHDSTSRDDWRSINLLWAAFLISAGLLFLYYVTDQPAAFTHITKANRSGQTLIADAEPQAESTPQPQPPPVLHDDQEPPVKADA